ncbi:hypothetical protein BLNAU_8434 [Blattamonas nauphoetae]|uniref:Transmembrane protein n=1 Tax=Blattamonas nauphoetae TaxID=2049346 RepID=A0ABQ9XYN5_9EUKA|nr:hypothetical protein BLNAU_8434 [Blattamonas nauphoetae]
MIENCRFDDSKSGGTGGSIYFFGNACSTQKSTFIFSESEGDGGSIFSSSGNFSLDDCSLTKSVSRRHGGVFAIKSAFLLCLHSLIKDCSSSLGGAAVHVYSGSYIMLLQSSFVAQSVADCLVFIGSHTRSHLFSSHFAVSEPHKNGCDVTFEAFPTSISQDAHSYLSSLTPTTSFQPVFSQLVPSLKFDDWFHDEYYLFHVAPNTTDGLCSTAHFCRTIASALDVIKPHVPTMIFMTVGDHHSDRIDSSLATLTLTTIVQEPNAINIHALDSTLFSLHSDVNWHCIWLALHRSAFSPLVLIEAGTFILTDCSLHNPQSVRVSPSPFIKADSLKIFGFVATHPSNPLPHCSELLSADSLQTLTIRCTFEQLVVNEELPLFSIQSGYGIFISSTTLKYCVFNTPFIVVQSGSVVMITEVSVLDTVFLAPLITLAISPLVHCYVNLQNFRLHSSEGGSTSPVISCLTEQGSTAMLTPNLQNSHFRSPHTDSPLLIRVSHNCTFAPLISMSSFSVVGPLTWCDETQREILKQNETEVEQFCSPVGTDVMGCGNKDTPCRTILFCITLLFPEQPSTIHLLFSTEEGGIVVFNRLCKIVGESQDVIITPSRKEPIEFTFVLLFSNLQLSSLVIHLSARNTVSEMQFALIKDKSTLTLDEMTFFLVSQVPLSKPPICIENGSLNALQLKMSTNFDSLTSSSSLVVASDFYDFTLVECSFSHLSFAEPILVLNTTKEGHFGLNLCVFRSLSSGSSDLFRIGSSAPISIDVKDCFFESCTCAGSSSSSFLHPSIPAPSTISLDLVASDDLQTAIILLSTDNISNLVNHSRFRAFSHLLPTHLQFEEEADSKSFVSQLITAADSIEVSDSAFDSIFCMQPQNHKCRTLQHVLLCLDNSPPKIETTVVSITSVIDTLTDTFSNTSPLRITSEIGSTISLHPNSDAKAVFVVENELNVSHLNFRVKTLPTRTTPLFHCTPSSELDFTLVSFFSQTMSITHPIVFVDSGSLFFTSVAFDFKCVVASPLISILSTQCIIEGCHLSSTKLQETGKLILVDQNSTIHFLDLKVEDMMSDASALINVQASGFNHELDCLTLNRIDILKPDSSLLSITATNSSVTITYILCQQISATHPNCSQVRIVLLSSRLHLSSNLTLCELSHPSSSAMVIVSDSHSIPHFEVTIISNPDYSLLSSVLLLIGTEFLKLKEDLTNGILNRDFLPRAVLWKEEEGSEPVLFLETELEARDEFYIRSFGTDRLKCGTLLQPCRTLNYALILPHLTNQIEVTLDGMICLSSSVELRTSDIVLTVDSEGTVLTSTGPDQIGQNTITARSVFAQQITFLLNGLGVLADSSFISGSGGVLSIVTCAVDVSGNEWEHPVFWSEDGEATIIDTFIRSDSLSIPTILGARGGRVLLGGIYLSAQVLASPLLKIIGSPRVELRINVLTVETPITKCETGLWEKETDFEDTVVRLHLLDVRQQDIRSDVTLIDSIFRNSAVLMSNCSFSSIQPFSPSNTAESTSMINLCLIKSSLSLESCEFRHCKITPTHGLTLLRVNTTESEVQFKYNRFEENTAASLVLFHPSAFSLFRKNSFQHNTFESSLGPVLVWNGTHQPLLPLFSAYQRQFVQILIVSTLLIVAAVVLLFVFPSFWMTRFCLSHEPRYGFWKRDGGQGEKEDDALPFVITRVQGATHRVIYSSSIVRGRVDEDTSNVAEEKHLMDSSSGTSSDSENVLDFDQEDSIVDSDKDT